MTGTASGVTYKSMLAKGSFEVTLKGEPPYDTADGITLSRASGEKRFSGALSGTSTVQMLSALTSVRGSAAYVAIERVEGTLDGKRGSFVAAHLGAMNRGAQSLTIPIVPDSGTGELEGISGKMTIVITEGQHFYELEYALP